VVISLAQLGPPWSSSVLAQSPPSLVINDVTVAEANSGSTIATFTVSFVVPGLHRPTSVSITTTAGTATPGGECGGAGVDFVGVSGPVVVILGPSEQSKQINVTVCGDTRDEPDQTFFVNLLNASGSPIQDGQGQATIIDDDPPPVLRIGDGTRGESPTSLFGAFGVSVVGSTDNVVSVRYTTADRTAIGGSCGTQGVDYEKTSSSITLPGNLIPGSPVTLPVRVCDDDVSEGDQRFAIQLSNATNATIQDGTGLVTITDDEPLPTLSITPAIQVSEPSALVPQVDAVFTVALSGPPTEQPVSLQYATAPRTASAGSTCAGGLRGVDYVTQTGRLTFVTAKSTQQIKVPICLDSTHDPNETFTVTLSGAANAVITQAVGTATIQ
jgi:hypothetical protein